MSLRTQRVKRQMASITKQTITRQLLVPPLYTPPIMMAMRALQIESGRGPTVIFQTTYWRYQK